MSKLTLDEAIKHCLEVAEWKDIESLTDRWNDGDEWSESIKDDCKQCAEEHRQIAKYLTELKELRVKVIQLEKDYEELEKINSKHMWETDNLLDMAKEDCRTIMELKRLLKLAVEDFEDMRSCLAEPYARLCGNKWRYADEALKLIGDEMCGKNDND